jgi:hypothetical protein
MGICAEEVWAALNDLGIEGLTVTEVKGFGRPKVTPNYTAAANTPWIFCQKSKLILWCHTLWRTWPFRSLLKRSALPSHKWLGYCRLATFESDPCGRLKER